jgi:hypothetical protein
MKLLLNLTLYPMRILILTLEELKELKKYIRGTGGQQLNLKTQLQTLDDRKTVAATALIDSGCTGN